MSTRHTIDVKTTTREEMIDITALVRAAVRSSGVDTGIACVFCPHTTAGITINENSQPEVKSDLLGHLRRMVPRDAGFANPDDNSDAHIKSSLLGTTLTLVVDQGRPVLGNWQAVYFCEFDGPRQRLVHVKVLRG